MSSSKTSITFQGIVDLDEAKSILRGLLSSLDEGKVVVQRGSEHVALTPAAVVELELTGKQKKDRQSIELEISWYAAPAVVPGGDLVISSAEPATDEAADSTEDENGEATRMASESSGQGGAAKPKQRAAPKRKTGGRR